MVDCLVAYGHEPQHQIHFEGLCLGSHHPRCSYQKLGTSNGICRYQHRGFSRLPSFTVYSQRLLTEIVGTVQWWCGRKQLLSGNLSLPMCSQITHASLDYSRLICSVMADSTGLPCNLSCKIIPTMLLLFHPAESFHGILLRQSAPICIH